MNSGKVRLGHNMMTGVIYTMNDNIKKIEVHRNDFEKEDCNIIK